MSTSAQIAANQQNARKSTGPTSAEGKALSSQNARTHGLTSADFPVRPGEEQELDDFVAGLTAELKPEGEQEKILFRQLAHDAWIVRCCQRSIATLYRDSQTDPMLDEQNEPKFRRIENYLRRAERSYYRALNELRALQTERAVAGAAAVRQSARRLISATEDAMFNQVFDDFMAKRTERASANGDSTSPPSNTSRSH